MTGVICVEKRDQIRPVAVTATCCGVEMVSTGREKSAMLARVMPHLKVGALSGKGKEGWSVFFHPSLSPPKALPHSLSPSHQKWIVLGPAGWFQKARARDATPPDIESGAVGFFRSRKRAKKNAATKEIEVSR